MLGPKARARFGRYSSRENKLMRKPKATKVTLKAARKQLALAYSKQDESTAIYGKACLGHRVTNMENGNRYRKDRALSRARAIVEAMVARNLPYLERVTFRDGDDGFVTFYLSGTEIVLGPHFSTADRFGLGPWVEGQLAAFLAERKRETEATS